MPLTPVTAPPFRAVAPRIRIGDATTGVDIQCAAESLAVEVEQDENTVETFCGSYTSYKAEVWTITAVVFQSYGAAGLWTLVRPLVGLTSAFAIVPDAVAAISVTNPIMSGTAITKAFPFFMGGKGEPESFDLVLAVQGTPTFAITGTFAVEQGVIGDDEADEDDEARDLVNA